MVVPYSTCIREGDKKHFLELIGTDKLSIEKLNRYLKCKYEIAVYVKSVTSLLHPL